MRKEIFRMERVTYKEAEITRLEDFNLQIYEGEIMGMVPFNGLEWQHFWNFFRRIFLFMMVIFIITENWSIPGKNRREHIIG